MFRPSSWSPVRALPRLAAPCLGRRAVHAKKVAPPAAFAQRAHVKSMEEYRKMWRESIQDPDRFWASMAQSFAWNQTWRHTCDWDLSRGHVRWFEGARLNVTANCLDRHVEAGGGSKPCLTFEHDDGSSRTFTYSEVLAEVSRLANALRDVGVRRGSRVTIYLPMVPELPFTMLACARIGAVHSVVFGGFSSSALADRIVDCASDVLVTSETGVRGGKVLPIKSVADKGLEAAEAQGARVQHCLVLRNGGSNSKAKWCSGRDVDLADVTASQSTHCVPDNMDAEDPLFILYTSGSTGKPKGVLHTQAGYMVYSGTAFKYIFDHQPDDVFFCTADMGWITGHTFGLYGPLTNGAHTVMFGGVPAYPSPSRLWEVCDKHRVTTLYTSPTAIRALQAFGDEPVQRASLDSLRLLGTVGEPINAEAWMWFYNVVGKQRCPIVDTWWQTETGAVMLAPFPGAVPTKPGCATVPFFGVQPAVVDEQGQPVPQGETGYLVVEQAWPGMMRTVYNNHERFVQTYLSRFPGKYFTGDGARVDEDGYWWITGRVDDVLNVSGHRIGTAELENAIDENEAVVECAVVGVPHDIKGQGIYCFAVLDHKHASADPDTVRSEIVAAIRQSIGPFATPDHIHFTPVLPKTRSGKIMRRILRKVAAGDVGDLGDTSTLADPDAVEVLLNTKPE